MKTRLSWLLASLGGAALLAVACAPSAEPAKQTAPAPAAEKPAAPAQAAPQQTAPKPAIQEVKPIQQETVRKEEPKPAEATVKTSVGGIPLDLNAKRGGILRVVLGSSEGPTFSTWEEAAGSSFQTAHPVSNMLIQPQTWGTLEDYKNLAFFKLQPDLAKSWEQSADGLKWIFKLRDGVKWSDGTPFTCADVKWSYDSIRTAQGLKRSPRAIHLLAVKEIQCPDSLTVIFNLSYPKAAFLEAIAVPYNVVRPKHIYEKNTDLMREKPPQVGTGPFVLKEWTPGEKTTLVRKADYWDQPLPYLEGLEARVLADSAVDAALRAGRLDVGPAQGYAGGRAETMLKECTVCVFYPRMIASSTSPMVFLHQQRPPWNLPEIEEAVALAIDNKKYAKVVQLDWSVPPTGCGFYPGGIWQMPAERCAKIPGYGDFFPGGDPEKDKARARELIAKAGFRPMELKVTVRFWITIRQDVPVIIEDLRAVGIDADAEILEAARAYAAWSAGEFDVGVHSFWIAGLDPDFILSEHFYTGSDRNYNRYSNVEFDRLVDRMSRTIDPEQRKRLAWDAMEMALRESGKVIVAHGTYMPTSNKAVRGWLPALNYLAGYGPMLRWQNVWLEQ